MNKNTYYSHSSYNALVAVALGPSEMPDDQRSSRREETRWAGGLTFEQAEACAKTGDLEGAKKLSPKILERAETMFQNTLRADPIYTLEGGKWIDVARFVRGEPECWGDFVELETAPKPGVAIAFNISAHSGISAEQMQKAGVELGGTILGLQALGYPVTLYFTMKVSSGDKSFIVSAPINDAGRMLDVSKMSAVFRPWFFRRVMFAYMETLSEEMRNHFGICHYGGYGRPGSLTADDLEKIAGGADRKIPVEMQEAVYSSDYIKRQIHDVVELTTAQ